MSGLRKRSSRHSKAIWLLAGSFALDIILTIALAATGAQVVHNANQLKDVQKVTSTEVLCPLYDIFISSSKAPPPPPNPGESQDRYRKRMAEREEAFVVIKDGYAALECKPKVEGDR